jgi:hypothetical protein
LKDPPFVIVKGFTKGGSMASCAGERSTLQDIADLPQRESLAEANLYTHNSISGSLSRLFILLRYANETDLQRIRQESTENCKHFNEVRGCDADIDITSFSTNPATFYCQLLSDTVFSEARDVECRLKSAVSSVNLWQW